MGERLLRDPDIAALPRERRLRVTPVPDDCSGSADPRAVKASRRKQPRRRRTVDGSGVRRNGAAIGRDADALGRLGRQSRQARSSPAARLEAPERPRRSRR